MSFIRAAVLLSMLALAARAQAAAQTVTLLGVSGADGPRFWIASMVSSAAPYAPERARATARSYSAFWYSTKSVNAPYFGDLVMP